MKITPSLLGSLIALSLSGCNSSDDSNSTVSTSTIKAIDGYLANASVYIDRNSNNIADENEFVGVTSERGELTVNSSQLTHPIIIKAIAGQTYDLDKGGRLTQSYELMADTSTTIITPFTTLAKINDITMETLAAQLGYDTALINSDYVKAKETNATAEQVHLLARSSMTTLNDTVVNSIKNKQVITQGVTTINNKVDELVNAGNNLNDIVIDASGNSTPMPPTLTRYLADTTLYQFSTNEFWFEHDLYSKMVFKDNTLTATTSQGEHIADLPINITNNTYTAKGTELEEEFIYFSHDFSLIVTSDGAMDFATTDASIIDDNTNTVNFNFIPATTSMFQGKDIYWLIDDAENSPTANVSLIEFSFDEIGDTGRYVNGNIKGGFSWYINADNQLTIVRDSEAKDWIFQPVMTNDDMIVSVMRHAPLEAHKYSRIPMFLINNKDLAESLKQEWIK